MADTSQLVQGVAMPAAPPAGEIVSQEVLSSRQLAVLPLTLGFGGVSNPTTIWNDMVRDSQRAFLYYRELEEKDDDVAGALEGLKAGVMERESLLTPADDSQQALDVTNFIRAQLDALDLERVLDGLLDAPGFGVAISECIYDVSEGQVGLQDIKDCPQELFTFAMPGFPQIGPLRFTKIYNDLASGGEPVPEEKFLVFTYRPRSRNRRGRPLLRSVFWPSWFKRQALRFELRFAEKGPGTAAVKYPQGGGADEQAKALAAAEAIIESVAVAVPENFQLVTELLTQARSQNPAVYKDLAERLALKITRRILGQTLTSYGSEQGRGSRSLGATHERTENRRISSVASGLGRVINDQLIRRLVFWNFGPNAPLPVWSVNIEADEDVDTRSQVDQRLQQMGVPIPLAYARKKYAIPEVKAGDEVLIPQTPVTAGLPTANVADASAPVFTEKVVRKQFNDVQRLLGELHGQAVDVMRKRVKQILGNAGGAQ